jgi:hypothetical protein
MGRLLRIFIQLVKCRIKGKFTQEFHPSGSGLDTGDVYSGLNGKFIHPTNQVQDKRQVYSGIPSNESAGAGKGQVYSGVPPNELGPVLCK